MIVAACISEPSKEDCNSFSDVRHEYMLETIGGRACADGMHLNALSLKMRTCSVAAGLLYDVDDEYRD